MLEFQNKDREIGENCTIHPEAKIINSVIGDNVIIENPITIRDSVIMPETKVVNQKDIIKSLIMNNFSYTLGE